MRARLSECFCEPSLYSSLTVHTDSALSEQPQVHGPQQPQLYCVPDTGVFVTQANWAQLALTGILTARPSKWNKIAPAWHV